MNTHRKTYSSIRDIKKTLTAKPGKRAATVKAA
ncbi:hypothetical protein HMPREF1484_02016 [Dermabacter sp. HFH0086]|nr:hypothetical protein HMPREF1484_02016 [Dermabacter sp. HFH0086]